MAAKAMESGAIRDFALRQFGGMNTQSARTMIGEGEFSSIVGYFPLGDGNMQPIPGPTTLNIPTATANVYWTKYVNITGNDYILFGDGTHLYTYGLTTGVSTTSNTGFNSPDVTQWKNERAIIVDPSQGCYSWDPVGGLVLIDATQKGWTVASYAGRIWIGNNTAAGGVVTFTAPDTYNDFQTIHAAGSFIVEEAYLRKQITALRAANGFLYMIGDSCVDAIGDVRVPSGTTTTLFSRVNLTTLSGCPLLFNYAVAVGDQEIYFSNTTGVYAISGSSVQKISYALDGFWQTIDLTHFTPSMCYASVNNVNMLLVGVNVKNNGPLQVFALYQGKWFIAHSEDYSTFTPFIYGAYKGDLRICLFATKYQLFSDATKLPCNAQTGTAKNMGFSTRLWDMGSPIIDKQALKVGVECVMPTTLSTFYVDVDDNITLAQNTFTGNNILTFLGADHQPLVFLDNNGNPITFTTSGTELLKGTSGGRGKYIGLTYRTQSVGININGLLLEYREGARW